MSAHLLIQDGSPWWLSPAIWVVPGNDPNGAPGAPVAGINAYLWARVSNLGDVAANATRIDFYWANPAAQIVVGVATFIGSAYADLAAGATQDVLCLVPWKPVIVNGGHECVLAVAHGAGDLNPIPNPLPSGYPFDPPAHDQIAQLNLSVLQASMIGVPLALFVNAIGRAGKRVTVEVEYGGELSRQVLANFGLRGLRPAQGQRVQASLSLQARCNDQQGTRALDIDVERGAARPVFVSLQARSLPQGQYQLVHVVERSEGKLLGGVSYLVINTADDTQPGIAATEEQLP
jgi:hypothetical protein